MVIPLLALGCGIILASLGLTLWGGFVTIFLGSLIYLWLLSLKKNPATYFYFSNWHYSWIFFWFLGIGIISESFSKPECPSQYFINTQKGAKGEVINISNKTSGDKMVVKVFSTFDSNGKKKTYDNFFLYVTSDAINCNIGNEIIFPLSGSVKRIENSSNSLKKGFAESMGKKGIFYTVNVEGNKISILYDGFSISNFISGMHDKAVAFIEKQPLATETKTFIIPLLTGDKAYLTDSTRTKFSEAGIAHILSLSGFHIGIIMALIFALLFPLNFLGKYKLRLLLTAIALWFYTVISGMSPSTVRACIMASVFIISILLERKNSSLNSLALAGFIILLVSPNSLFEIGFQLSFISVGVLIIFSNKLHPINRRFHPKLYNFVGLILASLIVTFATWTLTGYYFNSFPTMFLPANLIILPILPFYVFFILIYFVLNTLHFHIPIFGQVIDQIYITIQRILSIFGEDFLLTVHVPGYSVFLWMGGLICLAYLLYNKKTKLVTISTFLFFSLSITLIAFLPFENPNGIIIRGSLREFVIVAGNSIEEKEYCFPRHSVSLHSVYGKNILIIDKPILNNNVDNKSLDDFIDKCKSKGKIDFVVLANGYKEKLERIQETFNPDIIILHPSFRKKHEQILLNEADSLKISVHSIRKHKPFHISL